MSRALATHLSIHINNAQLLLRPSTELNQIIGGVLARLQGRIKVKIYSFCFLSNHFHLVYKKPSKKPYSFQQSALHLLEKRVNSLLGRSGRLWERRFEEQALFNQLDVLESIIHVHTNPVHHALVPEAELWPGLNSYKLEQRQFCFTDFESFYNASRTGSVHNIVEFQSKHTLHISRIPMFARLSKEQYSKLMNGLTQQRAIEIASQHTLAQRKFTGLNAILKQSPFDYPNNFSRRIEGISIAQLQALLPQQLLQVADTRGTA